jgi:hypothetical protein
MLSQGISCLWRHRACAPDLRLGRHGMQDAGAFRHRRPDPLCSCGELESPTPNGSLGTSSALPAARDNVTVRERRGIEHRACECYCVFKDDLNRLLGSRRSLVMTGNRILQRRRTHGTKSQRPLAASQARGPCACCASGGIFAWPRSKAWFRYRARRKKRVRGKTLAIRRSARRGARAKVNRPGFQAIFVHSPFMRGTPNGRELSS